MYFDVGNSLTNIITDVSKKQVERENKSEVEVGQKMKVGQKWK